METNIVNSISIVTPTRVKLIKNDWNSFSYKQQIAILKSAFFLISADDTFSESEKAYLYGLCYMTDRNNIDGLINNVKQLDTQEMFSIIKVMNRSQKETILYHWIQFVRASSSFENTDYQTASQYVMSTRGLFDLALYPREKTLLFDMANRCGIDISAFLSGPVQFC